MITIREDPLINNHYYHIYNRSIAKYTIFNNNQEFQRILQLIDLYRFSNFNFKLSYFNDLASITQNKILRKLKSNDKKIVSIVAFCIMPTHLHLLLKQNESNSISKYMGRILNSYSKFFNIQHNRFGPLWAGRFKSVLIKNNEQLLHLTRYIHLNPTSAKLVKNPENWEFSSYKEYIADSKYNNQLCETKNLFDINKNDYKKFVNNRKNYQRELALIKSTLIDGYSG
jgi:putative transposase